MPGDSLNPVVEPVKLNRTPEAFLRAQAALRRAQSAGPVVLEEISAPGRLAPWAAAIGATVSNPSPQPDGPEELGTGRLVLLYDPEKPVEWASEFRIVSYIRAELEHELGNEALLGPVAWSWLTDALEQNDCQVTNSGGTTTRVFSESFGTLADRPATIDLELRASWTPVLESPDHVDDHVDAWIDLLCTVAGLPPLPAGVTAFPGRRR